MVIGIIVIGLPLVIYLALVMVPAGRPLTILIGLVAAFMAYVWIGYLLSWAPFWTGEARADAYTIAGASVYSVAFVAGTVTATLGRRVAARATVLPYPLIAVLILVVTLVPPFSLLGL